ncbi:DUF4350 domain-containing protein [Nocardioides pacificus]
MTWLRRHRSALVVGVAVLAALAVAVVAGGAPQDRSGALDPENPRRSGAQALARVLADNGVDVQIARGADALEDADIDATTTVVVTSTEQLGESTARGLLEVALPGVTGSDGNRSGEGGRLVIVEPDMLAVDALGLDLSPSSVTVGSGRSAACSGVEGPDLDGLTLQVDRALAYDADGCFADDDGDALLVEPRPGLLVLGAGQALENDQVLRADNAAVALRLLGQDDDLVWYVPDARDLSADDSVGLADLLPRWLGPGLAVATLTVIALLLWRGRRLGRLVTEPLPVVVKAVETTQSRGRLYRKAGDRAHAAHVLRRATRLRAAERLRLPATTPPAVLVREVASHLARRPEDVHGLLAPDAPPPTDDRALLTLASDLAALEEEVRRR